MFRPALSTLLPAAVLILISGAAADIPGPEPCFGWAAYPEAGQGLYVNPAAYSFLHGLRLRLGISTSDSAIERLDLAELTVPGAGFAIWSGGGGIRRYSTALSSRIAGGPVSVGISWSWIDTDRSGSPWNGAGVFTAGVTVRPYSWLGAGAFYSAASDVPGQETGDLFGGGLALRPAGRLLTMTADIRADPGFDDISFSAGLEARPLAGLVLRGEVDEDGFIAGLGVELGRSAISTAGLFTDEPDFRSGRAEILLGSSQMENILGEGKRFVRIEPGGTDELPTRRFLGPRERCFSEQMILLERLIADPDVEGIVLDTGKGVGNPAQAEELRTLAVRFAETGRPVYVMVENGGNSTCYVASAGKVLIHPAGEISLTGLAATSFFARDFLDRLGVYPDLLHIGDFKSASDMFTRSDMSEAQMLATTELLESMQEELVRKVSEARGLDPGQMSDILRDGLFTSRRAVTRGLADEVVRPDDVTGVIERDLGRSIRVVSLDNYAASIPVRQAWEPEPHVAVVIATGLIVPGKSGEVFLLGRTMGSETLTSLLREAAAAPGVRALVLRIDSGGGDALASDDIHHTASEIADRIPVVVSMGGAAASGGYHIACAADVVYADAMTVTGSIGIISGKFSFGGLLEKLGVNTVQTSISPSGGIGSPFRPYTNTERERVFMMMSDGYDLFVSTVAEDRGMTWDEVDAIGRGRVWSGTDALEIGIVDSLGGVVDAIDCAARLGGIHEEHPPVRIYPEPSFLGSFSLGTGLPGLGAALQETVDDLLLTEGRLLYLAMPLRIE